MPTTLIILAHPEQRSFNGAWAQESATQSEALGHKVLWSNLYALGFNPNESASHYSNEVDIFDPLKAQENAAAAHQLPTDVQTEIDKIKQADRLIFHFPIWWFSPPAILKGWCDRALTHGALHTTNERFDSGMCKDKKVLFCVTTGAPANESAHNGKEGDIQMLLWPLAYTLRYLGMTILRPKVIAGVHGYFRDDSKVRLENRLKNELSGHQQTITIFDSLPEIQFNADSEFDDNNQLKPEANSHSYFIRHKP